MQSRRADTRAGHAPAILFALLAACARPRVVPPSGIVQQAIAARGGPIASLVRWIDADVHAGVPGVWQGRIVFVAPNRYALTIVATGEWNHHVYDGTFVRSFIGDRLVAAEDSRAPLATQARFEGFVNLDALLRPGVRLEPLPAAELPAGAVTGVTVIAPGDGARYRLGFDRRTLLVWAAGPLDFSPFGRGEIDVAFDDFREAGRRLLPSRITYTMDGAVFLEQRLSEVCVNDPNAGDAWFATPASLPACGAQ